MNEEQILAMAQESGIRFDSFGCPVVDHKSVVIEFAKKIETYVLSNQPAAAVKPKRKTK